MEGIDLGSPWSFVVVGVILIGLEMAAPGVFLIWLGLASLVVGLVNFAVRLPWEANGLLFAVLAILLVLIGKRLTRRHFDDAIWAAKGPDLPTGTRVKVVAASGKVVTVESVSSEK